MGYFTLTLFLSFASSLLPQDKQANLTQPTFVRILLVSGPSYTHLVFTVKLHFVYTLLLRVYFTNVSLVTAHPPTYDDERRWAKRASNSTERQPAKSTELKPDH